MTRSISSLLHLSGDEVRELAAAAATPTPSIAPLVRKVVAILSFGPEDPPPAAWIAAAVRLGAGVIRESDLGGERDDPIAAVADAGRWADVIVVSHPLTGFARVAAEVAGKPVVNAGEGGGESPASGIALLAAACPGGLPTGSRRLRAAVCGDLAESRSARAFLAALATIDATVLLVPARGHELSDDDVQRLARRIGRSPLRFEAHAMSSLLDMVDTVLLGHEATPQLPLFREVGVPPDEAARRARREVEDLDVLFVAAGGGAPDRIVREPFRSGATRLPQGTEHVVPLRALEVLLQFAAAGTARPETGSDARSGGEGGPPEPEHGRYRSGLGLACRGERCAGAKHRDVVSPDFAIVTKSPLRLECLHCGAHAAPRFGASKIERRFHGLDGPDAAKILPANLVLFRTRGEAMAAGFEPAKRKMPDDAEAM